MLRVLTTLLVILTGCSSPPPTPKQPTAAEILNIPASFAPSYEVVVAERYDTAAGPRLSAKVRVPPGLTRADLDANVRHALLKAYEGDVKFGAVDVLAYTSANVARMYDAAHGTFAPGGQWGSADPDVPLSQWQVRVNFADAYFQAPD